MEFLINGFSIFLLVTERAIATFNDASVKRRLLRHSQAQQNDSQQ
jgi:hypothetical protein